MSKAYDLRWLKTHKFEDEDVDDAFEMLDSFLNNDSFKKRCVMTEARGLKDGDKYYIFKAPSNCLVTDIFLLSDTATASTTPADNHQVLIKKYPEDISMVTTKISDKGNLVANEAYAIYSDPTGYELNSGDILRMDWTDDYSLRLLPNRKLTRTYADGDTKDGRVMAEMTGAGASLIESYMKFAIDQASTEPAYFRTIDSLPVSGPYRFTIFFENVGNVGSTEGRILTVHSTDWDGQPAAADSNANFKLTIVFIDDNNIKFVYGDGANYKQWDGAAWQAGASTIGGTWAANTKYIAEIENDGTDYIIRMMDEYGNQMTGSPATIAISSVNDSSKDDHIAIGNNITNANREINLDVTQISILKFPSTVTDLSNAYANIGVEYYPR